MNMKKILALGAAAGLAALAGCESKPNAPESKPSECKVEAGIHSLTIACEDPYLRFEARQVYDAAIQTQMNYKNSLGDTIELHGDMPENYDNNVAIYFFHVWDHYGFRLSGPDENPSDKEKKLANRLSAKWLDNCRQANCIEEVAKWLETGKTPEERIQGSLAWDESAYPNPGNCQINMKQRKMSMACDNPFLEFEAVDSGSYQRYTISYNNLDGGKVSIKAGIPADYNTLPKIYEVLVPNGGMNFFGQNMSEEETRLVEDAAGKWMELCKLINCIQTNADWLEYRASIQPGDEANIERRDFDEPFNNGRLTGYSIWQMVPNRELLHEVTPRKTDTLLSVFYETEKRSKVYFDFGSEGTVDLIHAAQWVPYSLQRFVRGEDGTEAMFEAADAELAEAKKEMGAE